MDDITRMKLHFPIFFVFLLCFFSCSEDSPKVIIQNSLNDPQVEYAIRQFHSESTLHALKTHPTAKNWINSSGIDTSLGSEAYHIRTVGDEIEVIGGNGAGVIYGLLHVKEQLEQGKAKIQDIEESPRFPFRANKFNLPWSAHRKAKALEIHKETCPFSLYSEGFLSHYAPWSYSSLPGVARRRQT